MLDRQAELLLDGAEQAEHGVSGQDDPDAKHEVFRVELAPGSLTLIHRASMLTVVLL